MDEPLEPAVDVELPLPVALDADDEDVSLLPLLVDAALDELDALEPEVEVPELEDPEPLDPERESVR